MIEGIKQVGVVGAGAMAAGVAQTFAVAGYPVRLQDIGEAPLEPGMGAIKKSFERLVARDKLKPEARDAALRRIAPTTRIEDLADCDVVVEAVLERFEIKKEVFGTSTASAGPRRSWPPTPPRSGHPDSLDLEDPGPRHRHVFLQSRARDAARRDHPCVATTDATCDRIVKLTEDIGKKARVSKNPMALSSTACSCR